MGDLRRTISEDEFDEYERLKAVTWTPHASMLRQIGEAYLKARAKHAPMRGPHEGYAVILEELDELWDEVKAWQPDFGNRAEMRKEALHVAAMALAFLLEVV